MAKLQSPRPVRSLRLPAKTEGFVLEAAYDISVSRGELPPPLRPYVHEYYEVGFEVPAGRPLRVPVSATTDPALNVTLTGSVTVRIGYGFRLPPVVLAGPQPEAYTVEPSGAEPSGVVRGFYVRFTTVGPLALLGVEDYSLGEHGVRPLHAMVRPSVRDAARTWEAALLAAPTFAARVALTNRFLLDHGLPPDHREEPGPRVRLLQAAVAAIEQAGGNVRIGELARRLGVSESTLRRHFGVLGMPPKRFAGVVRFRRAHAYLRTTPGATWADVVARFGYADQAHFVRDYRRFSGAPPTRWELGPRAVDRRMGIEAPPREGD
jgi:AraC-like DNA-binding protein